MEHALPLILEVALDLANQDITLLDRLAQILELFLLRGTLGLESLNDCGQLTLDLVKDLLLLLMRHLHLLLLLT